MPARSPASVRGVSTTKCRWIQFFVGFSPVLGCFGLGTPNSSGQFIHKPVFVNKAAGPICLSVGGEALAYSTSAA